jgi:hypothetical protein
MAISKSKRFEVFARDSFTCQYCGRRPPEVVLEVDHIHPRSKSGADADVNLITSCWDCNRGKAAKVISDIAPRPDADVMFLRVQQEIAEAERYLAAKSKLDEIHDRLRAVLSYMWQQQLSADIPDIAVWNQWIKKYGAEEVEIAISKCATKAQFSDLGRGTSWRRMTECSKYVSGILKKRMADREGGDVAF